MALAQSPTLLPGPVAGWTGQYKACRGCGNRSKMEIAEGYCPDCYQEQYGALGLGVATRRQETPPAVVDCVECGRSVASWAAIRYTSGEYACKDVDDCMAALADRQAAATIETTPAPPPPAPWHPEHAACLDCGSSENRYASRGLCAKCYPATLKPGYTGNAAPKKPPLGKAPRVETAVEAVVTTVAQPTPAPADTPLPTFDDEPDLPITLGATAATQDIAPTVAPDLTAIPLADLFAEVQRRLEAMMAQAQANAADAAKYRQIAAITAA